MNSSSKNDLTKASKFKMSKLKCSSNKRVRDKEMQILYFYMIWLTVPMFTPLRSPSLRILLSVPPKLQHRLHLTSKV